MLPNALDNGLGYAESLIDLIVMCLELEYYQNQTAIEKTRGHNPQFQVFLTYWLNYRVEATNYAN